MTGLRESKFVSFKNILNVKFRQNVQHRWNCGTGGYIDTDNCCKVIYYITESLINLSQNNYSLKAFTTLNHFCNFQISLLQLTLVKCHCRYISLRPKFNRIWP